MALIVGYLAAFLTSISFFPQAVQTIRTKSTEDLSLSMYACFWVGILFWLIYGVMIQDLVIIIANGVTIIPSSIILFLKLNEKKQ